MIVREANAEDLEKFEPEYYLANDSDTFIHEFVDNGIDLHVDTNSFEMLVSEDDLIDMVYAIVSRGIAYCLYHYGYRGPTEPILRWYVIDEEVARTQEQLSEDNAKNRICAGNSQHISEILYLQTLREQIEKLNIPKQEKVIFYEKTRKKNRD